MQLVKGGPDIDVAVLQALEDGKLVFFCGAGISYPAGLPGFKDLVSNVMRSLGEALSQSETVEFKAGNYDRVFTLVEKRLGSNFIRTAVKSILTIDPAAADLSTHKALLDLSKGPLGYRLVTTNFDNGFSLAAPGATIASHTAPLLPVPKNQWCTLVHIHGRLDATDPESTNLVLSSGDFGKAYLTERWASRFITELFRRFTVLFVGYSISDPVIRYMMDALAADRLSGEAVKDAYVLADYNKSTAKSAIEAWKAKNVIPIPFDRRGKFALLHKTLGEWAAIHRDGLIGKEGIVGRYASLVPKLPYDEAVSQLAWAISEASGHVASVFAQHEPEPPIEWLPVFESQGFLDKLVVPVLGARGAPLVDHGPRVECPPDLHPITHALAGWLTRHLDKKELIDWIVGRGGCLHPAFKDLVRHTLAIRWSPWPYAITRVWRLLISDLLACDCHHGADWFDGVRRIRDDPWTPDLKLVALENLAPRLSLSRSLWQTMPGEPVVEMETPQRVGYYVDADVGLTSEDFARELIEAAAELDSTRLSDLADEATSLLQRAMLLLESVDKASGDSDFSYIHIPSIAPNDQNQWFEDWTLLVEIVRLAWEGAFVQDMSRARSVAYRWGAIPYPVFRRLLFHAMSKEGVFTHEETVDALLARRAWWLWSVETQHESYAVLRAVWTKVPSEVASRLVNAILAGPPREMFRDDVEEARLERIVHRETWKLLKKLESFGRELTSVGQARLGELELQYPEWRLQPGDEDEFPVYSTSWVGPPSGEGPKAAELLNRPIAEVVALLSKIDEEKRKSILYEWGAAAGRRPRWTVAVLKNLSGTNQWDEDVWHAALNALQDRTWPYLWRHLSGLLREAPQPFLQKGLARFSTWIRDYARVLSPRYESMFLLLWDRLAELAEAEAGELRVADPVTQALNAPTGVLGEALLNRLAVYHLTRDADLPESLKPKFTLIAEKQDWALARVLFASRLGQLFAISPEWTRRYLLPRFQWNQSKEASAVWQAYTWAARIYPDLLAEIKPDLIEGLRRRATLDRHSKNICQLFAIAAISFRDAFTVKEEKEGLGNLDSEGLAEVANTLARSVDDVKEKADELFKNRVGPLITRAWPKDRDKVDPRIARALLLVAISTKDEFPEALETVKKFLVRTDDASFLVHRLCGTDHPKRHPQQTLEALDLVIGDDRWPPRELREVLAMVLEAWPQAAATVAYRRLDEYLRRHRG